MVLYRCKESYTITIKNEDESLFWDFNNFPFCFADKNRMQSITLIPNKTAGFDVIEDSKRCNILRHVYDSGSYFEILLGSTQENADTDTIWLHTMNVYQD